MSQIQSYFGDQQVTTSNVEVRVNSAERALAVALVKTSQANVQVVQDEETFTRARETAAGLKAILDQIEADRKAAKLPYTAVGRKIDEVANGLATPVKTEQNRVLALLNGYVEKLEAEREAERRREAEAKRLAQEKADREVREAKALLAKAQAELKAAHDEAEASRLREAAQKRENQLLQQQLAAELAADVEGLGKDPEPPRGLVPDGRVDHNYKFTLVDPVATVRAGSWRLLRWELDIRACQDAVKNLVECAPNVEPELPGIKIVKQLSVSVKAAPPSRIT